MGSGLIEDPFAFIDDEAGTVSPSQLEIILNTPFLYDHRLPSPPPPRAPMTPTRPDPKKSAGSKRRSEDAQLRSSDSDDEEEDSSAKIGSCSEKEKIQSGKIGSCSENPPAMLGNLVKEEEERIPSAKIESFGENQEDSTGNMESSNANPVDIFHIAAMKAESLK